MRFVDKLRDRFGTLRVLIITAIIMLFLMMLIIGTLDEQRDRFMVTHKEFYYTGGAVKEFMYRDNDGSTYRVHINGSDMREMQTNYQGKILRLEISDDNTITKYINGEKLKEQDVRFETILMDKLYVIVKSKVESHSTAFLVIGFFIGMSGISLFVVPEFIWLINVGMKGNSENPSDRMILIYRITGLVLCSITLISPLLLMR